MPRQNTRQNTRQNANNLTPQQRANRPQNTRQNTRQNANNLTPQQRANRPLIPQQRTSLEALRESRNMMIEAENLLTEAVSERPKPLLYIAEIVKIYGQDQLTSAQFAGSPFIYNILDIYVGILKRPPLTFDWTNESDIAEILSVLRYLKGGNDEEFRETVVQYWMSSLRRHDTLGRYNLLKRFTESLQLREPVVVPPFRTNIATNTRQRTNDADLRLPLGAMQPPWLFPTGLPPAGLPAAFLDTRRRPARQNSLNNAQNANNNRVLNTNNVNYSNTSSVYSWAFNADEEDEFPAVCETLISNADPIYEEFKRKISKICTNIVSPPKVSKSSLGLPKQDNAKLENIDPDKCLDALSKILAKNIVHPVSLKGFKITYKNQEGVGPGVVRDFISRCMNEVVRPCDGTGSTPLLVPISEGSDVFTVDKNLNLDANTKKRLRTLGYLLAIMCFSDLSFAFKLKRSLLHMCLFNSRPSRDVSYVAYELMEDPEWAMGVTAVLKDPSIIGDLDLDFEDVGRSKKAVTKGNYISYLRNYVEFNYIPPGCQYVADGFYKKIIAGEMITKILNMGVQNIYERICKPTIDVETINNFVNTQIVFGETLSKDVITWFIDLIKKSDVKFFRSLLHFWSGLYSPMKDKQYQVVNGQREVRGDTTPLAEAHTCYTQLVLPQNIPDAAKLKYIIETSIYNVEHGIGLYGGRKKKPNV